MLIECFGQLRPFVVDIRSAWESRTVKEWGCESDEIPARDNNMALERLEKVVMMLSD